jgi:hypothetical protein
MKHAYKYYAGGQVSEMAIVDTFTKLIFGETDHLSDTEESIIRTFRLVDGSVSLDTHAQMGDYLRALGVAEMIHLVTLVQTCISDGLPALASASRASVLDRRAH